MNPDDIGDFEAKQDKEDLLVMENPEAVVDWELVDWMESYWKGE